MLLSMTPTTPVQKTAAKAEMPFMETPEQLYNYYKTLECVDERNITKDLNRTDPGNTDWMIDYKTGSNGLFNVLKAQANYFDDLGYSQGMNFLVSWILRHTRQYKTDENE